ncbi:antibiotic biosynthesis monooxygenase [bacterium]|nr:antibiotic biosynthesis monooxygenase [bacterium]
MIRLRGRMVCVNQDELQALRRHLTEHVRLTRAEPGCLQFEIVPCDDPMIHEVLESFRDRASFDAHQARTRDSAWFAATRHILRDFRLEEIGD